MSGWVFKLISSFTIEINNTDVYLMSEYTNVMIEYTMMTNQKRLYTFVQEDNEENLFTAFAIIDGRIIFVPCDAKNMWQFDLQKKELSEVKGIVENDEIGLNGKFLYSISYKNKMYLYGGKIEGITKIVFDREGNCSKIKINNMSGLSSISCVVGERIYILSRDQQKIIRIMAENDCVDVIDLQNYIDIETVETVAIDDGKVIVLYVNGRQQTLMIDDLKCCLLDSEILNKEKNSSFERILYCYDTYYYFSCSQGKIGVKRGNEIDMLPFEIDDKDLKRRRENEYIFIFVKKINDIIYFQNRLNGKVYYIANETHEIKDLIYELDNDIELSKIAFDLYFKKGKTKVEKGKLDLQDFINIIKLRLK